MMFAAYRKQILENIVPLASKLRKEQKNRMGLDKLSFYDEPIFKSVNLLHTEKKIGC